MRACDDNALVELADGALAPDAAASVLAHVDDCASCRAVLAGLARSESGDRTAATRRAASPPLSPTPEIERLPAELLRDYLERDAPRRERAIALFWACFSALALLLFLFVPIPERRFPEAGLWIQTGFLCHEIALYWALRRGFYRRFVPLAAMVVELTVAFAMQLALAATAPPELVLSGPGQMIWAMLIVFTAVRADPRLCLAAGALTFGESLLLQYLLRERGEVVPPQAGVAPVFLLFAGVAGAIVARHLVRRAEAALHDLREQDLFGKYLLHERLGSGGMGEVFRATYCPEGGFTRTVAVKRVREDLSSEPAFAEAFRKEARLGAGLAHPNLVQVLDCGKLRGSFMLAMEHVDGLSLARLLSVRSKPLAPQVVSYLGAEIAAALHYLHSRRGADGAPAGLVHCDVNPPNVLVSHIGEVKLTDFGVARAAASAERSFGGKVAYAAPEQLRGEPLDGRADLFGLGLTLHQALTGRRVFEREGERALDAPMVAPSQSRPDVPAELDGLVMELLSLDREARPPSAASVRARLRAFAGPLAPYPDGQDALARCVREALARD